LFLLRFLLFFISNFSSETEQWTKTEIWQGDDPYPERVEAKFQHQQFPSIELTAMGSVMLDPAPNSPVGSGTVQYGALSQ